jgi:hydrogenase nickel incorporation protein HypA/HybF
MHELSLVRNIIESVSTHPGMDGESRVRKILLRVGEAAGVETTALEFGFRCLSAGTPLEAAFLEIEKVPFTVACRHCGATNRTDPVMNYCPACGNRDVEVLGGCELDIISIEVESAGEEAA